MEKRTDLSEHSTISCARKRNMQADKRNVEPNIQRITDSTRINTVRTKEKLGQGRIRRKRRQRKGGRERRVVEELDERRSTRNKRRRYTPVGRQRVGVSAESFVSRAVFFKISNTAFENVRTLPHGFVVQNCVCRCEVETRDQRERRAQSPDLRPIKAGRLLRAIQP